MHFLGGGAGGGGGGGGGGSGGGYPKAANVGKNPAKQIGDN